MEAYTQHLQECVFVTQYLKKDLLGGKEISHKPNTVHIVVPLSDVNDDVNCVVNMYIDDS